MRFKLNNMEKGNLYEDCMGNCDRSLPEIRVVYEKYGFTLEEGIHMFGSPFLKVTNKISIDFEIGSVEDLLELTKDFPVAIHGTNITICDDYMD